MRHYPLYLTQGNQTHKEYVVRLEKPINIHGLNKMTEMQQKVFRDTGRSITDRQLKIT